MARKVRRACVRPCEGVGPCPKAELGAATIVALLEAIVFRNKL